MTEQITKKFTNSPEIRNSNNENQSVNGGNTWDNKASSNQNKSKDLASTLNKENKLKQHLFSEKNTKSVDDPNTILRTEKTESKSISKMDPNEKNYKTVSELEINKSNLLKSGIQEKKIKSYRHNMVVFKKFKNKKNTKSPTMKAIEKNFKTLNVSDWNLEDDVKSQEDINVMTQETGTLDFIANNNLKNEEKFPIKTQLVPITVISKTSTPKDTSTKNIQIVEKIPKLYQLKKETSDTKKVPIIKKDSLINAKKANFSSRKKSSKNTSKNTSKYNTEKTARSREDFKNVYDSIGKIKEFVKKSSIIEIKPLTLTQDLTTVRKNKKGNNPLYQSEQGKWYIIYK